MRQHNVSEQVMRKRRNRICCIDEKHSIRYWLSTQRGWRNRERWLRFSSRSNCGIVYISMRSGWGVGTLVLSVLASGKRSATFWRLSKDTFPSSTGSFPQASRHWRQTLRHSWRPSSTTYANTLSKKCSSSRRAPRFSSDPVTGSTSQELLPIISVNASELRLDTQM